MLVLLFCDDSGKLRTPFQSPAQEISIFSPPRGPLRQTATTILEALCCSIEDHFSQTQEAIGDQPLISVMIPYIQLQLERVHWDLAILEAKSSQERQYLKTENTSLEWEIYDMLPQRERKVMGAGH